MKRLLLLAIVFCLLSAAYAILPTCYDTYDEIVAKLYDFEAQNPDHAKVHLLGYSQQDNVPIYGIKVSNNVLIDQDQQAVLFVGQVHAEEVLGVQVTLSNINEILLYKAQSPYNQWLSQLEMWFVPTLNPEGHNVVTANIDTSYRKNKRDNNNNGIFDYSPLVGYDIDGVDINRNFWFNWVHGDTLMQPGGLEYYDYYRGPEPMSESEVQAIKALCDQKKFTYSICWHSSRTGNLSEKVYYSFNWKEVRPSPDLSLAAAIGQGVASQIPNQSNPGTYQASPNLSRKGCFHDWMYQQYGTIQLLIEVGTADLQPDSLMMVNTIQRATNGVKWLLNRALAYSTAVPSNSLLTGYIRDADTNEPLEAEIIVEQRHAPWFAPRKSKPDTGRFFRPLASGTYTIRVRKKGYIDHVIPNQVVNNSALTMINVSLQKKQEATLSGWVRSNGQPIPAKIVLHDLDPDTLYVNGEFLLNTYVSDQILIEVTADGYFPFIKQIEIVPGQNHLFVNLSPVNIIFSESWENGSDNWFIEGPWVLQNELSASGYAITDSWGGRGLYAVNADVNIRMVNPVSLPSTNDLYLVFDHHLYTEWDYDIVSVEISHDHNEWQSIWTKSGRFDWWHTEHIDLNEYRGQNLYFRFRLKDESNHIELTDPGWTLDNIKIISGTATPNFDYTNNSPVVSALYPNSPNPFNPETNIRFSLAKPSRVKLGIYNMKGQKVATLVDDMLSSGLHHRVWKGTDDGGRSVSSGVYFYRLETENFNRTMKMVLVK